MFVFGDSGAGQGKYSNYSNPTHSFFEAVEENDRSGMDLFLSRGADIHAKNSYGQTILHVVVSKDNYSAVEFILTEELLDPNIENSAGEPPIFLAQSAKMLKLLVSKGASISKTTPDDTSLMHYAATRDRSRIVHALATDLKQDVNATDNNGRTPLHFAAKFDCTDTVGVLLRLGANIDAQTDRQYTPLHYAAIGNHKTTKTARKLLGPKGNARYNMKNFEGKTALDLTKQNNSVGREIINTKISHEARTILLERKLDEIMHGKEKTVRIQFRPYILGGKKAHPRSCLSKRLADTNIDPRPKKKKK